MFSMKTAWRTPSSSARAGACAAPDPSVKTFGSLHDSFVPWVTYSLLSDLLTNRHHNLPACVASAGAYLAERVRSNGLSIMSR
jgi:hypothetical protein